MIEITVIGIMLVCNLILANEWAIHGFWELSLQRPPNKRAINAALIGMLTFTIGGILQKYGHIQFVYLTEKMLWQTGSILLIPPVLWIFLKRAFLMPKGCSEFNRSVARMKHWTMQYYRPGQILKEPGALLAQFPMALKTLELFERSIEEQKRGILVPIQQRIIDLETTEADYGGTIQAPCPNCNMTSRLPIHISDGVTGQCLVCNTMLSAKRIGDKIYVSAHVSRRTVTPQNKQNISVAYEEMALLYRMMNRFDKAHEALDEAVKIVNGLLDSSLENKAYQMLKSLILFRRAEAYHAQGIELQKAKELYQESLDLDEKFNDGQDSTLTRELLEQLP